MYENRIFINVYKSKDFLIEIDRPGRRGRPGLKHELKLKSMNENFGPITLKMKKTCDKEFKLISFSRTPVGDFLCVWCYSPDSKVR